MQAVFVKQAEASEPALAPLHEPAPQQRLPAAVIDQGRESRSPAVGHGLRSQQVSPGRGLLGK